MDEARTFISWLAGVGGTTVILVVCYLVGKGRLRLEREVLELMKQLIAEQQDKIFWRNLALRSIKISEDTQQLGRDAVVVAQQAIKDK
jgi:hypothetical protein